MYDIFFINFSDDGHLGIYQLLAIMNKPGCFLVAHRITNNGLDPSASLINQENASQSCLLDNPKRAFSLLRFPLPIYSNLYQVDPKLPSTNYNNTAKLPSTLKQFRKDADAPL